MGYTTDFFGEFEIYPPLNKKENLFFNNFNETRRVERSVDSNGRYYVADGYNQDSSNILQNNNTPIGQPSLWCGFLASEDGKYIVWDGGEKTYSAANWIKYFITHFLGNHPLMESINPELYEKYKFSSHIINGVMYAKGEDYGDAWRLTVEDNCVFTEFADKSQFVNDFDQDSDDSEEDYAEKQYEKWYNIELEDLKNLTYLPKVEVKYDSKNMEELEFNNIQESLRGAFVKAYKDNLVSFEEIKSKSKSKPK